MTDREFEIIIKKQRYKGAIFSYGIITLLYVLSEYEQAENYEECQIIIESISEFNKYWDFKGKDKLPSTMTGLNIKEFLKDAYALFHMKPDNYMDNIDYYAELLKKDIAKWNEKHLTKH